jgi:hypothetical protein
LQAVIPLSAQDIVVLYRPLALLARLPFAFALCCDRSSVGLGHWRCWLIVHAPTGAVIKTYMQPKLQIYDSCERLQAPILLDSLSNDLASTSFSTLAGPNMSSELLTLAAEPLEEFPQLPSSPEFEAKTPVPNKAAYMSHIPADSLVSISLSDPDPRSPVDTDLDADLDIDESEVSSQEVVEEVLKRASQSSPIDSLRTVEDVVVDLPRSEQRLVKEVARERARSRSGSLAMIPEATARARSGSDASDGSVQVDWERLDKTERHQHEDQAHDEVRLFADDSLTD